MNGQAKEVGGAVTNPEWKLQIRMADKAARPGMQRQTSKQSQRDGLETRSA